MRFEILGEIADAETFATGAGIREIARLRRVYCDESMGAAAGASVRGSPAFGWRMALSLR
jgi:hypothetical protein